MAKEHIKTYVTFKILIMMSRLLYSGTWCCVVSDTTTSAMKWQKQDLLKHWQLSTIYIALHPRRQKPSHKIEHIQPHKYNTSINETDLSEIISTRSKWLYINPLPVQFTALLHRQKGCVFSSGHLNLRTTPETGLPSRKKKIITIKLKKTKW